MGEDRFTIINQYGNDIEFTEDQRKCVEYKSKTALIIKGTAGSGKTYMVVARARDYYNESKEALPRKRVAVFTYNKSLRDAIISLMKRNGIQPDDWLTVTNADSYLSIMANKEHIVPRDSNGQTYGGHRGYRSRDAYAGFSAVTDKDRVIIVEKILVNLAHDSTEPYYRYDPQFWADEILWMYQNGIVDGDDEDRYIQMSREGRCKKYRMVLREKGRRAGFKIFNEYNETLLKKRKFEWDRLYALLCREHLGSIKSNYGFDYVLIDEAQDLSLVKMRLLVELCKDELTVAMDKNQSIYGHRWSFKDAGLVTKHVKSLKTKFRNTMQIDLLAQDLKKVDDSLIEDEDRYCNEISTIDCDILPRVYRCSTSSAQRDLITDLLKSSNPNVTTAILCPDYAHIDDYATLAKSTFPNVQVFRKDEHFSMFEPGIKIMTIHSSKGLEFTNVIIPDFKEGVYPKSPEAIINSLKRGGASDEEAFDADEAISEEIAESRRLAYVGITRAGVALHITYAGEPSRFIKEFDPDHYELLDEYGNPAQDLRISQHRARSRPLPVFGDPVEVRCGADVPNPKESMDGGIGGAEEQILHLLSDFIVIDKRPAGALWVLDCDGLSERIKYLEQEGYGFRYSPNGSRSTDYRPAYYWKG